VLLTAIRDLKGFEELGLGQRIPGLGFDRTDTRQNWLDRRSAKQRYDDREPEVLIVGGGHSGVMMAARLAQLGIDALIVDRFPRIGDNWRTRYSSLALHNETDVCHFPYLPFPPTFPQYLPKDKLANWFEAYVESLELNYWTSTEFTGAEYDYAEDRWVATARQADGHERQLRPRHIIVATGGVGGTPNVPALPGAERFGGTIVHTKDFRTGADLAGRDVLVVGVGTSAHDVAFDLHGHGAHVTMLQRHPTVVINIDSANLLYAHYTAGISTDEADLIGAANFIYPVLTESLRSATRMTAERDAALLDRLRAAGMRIDMGEDGTGYLMKFFRHGGGYYINVGCSELIADGKIGVLQSADVTCLSDHGMQLADGTVRHLDAVVLATGYLNQQTEVRRYFGDEVADRVGEISGFDERGEIRNGWRQTAQRGLWFVVGGIGQGRIYSMPLAAQIATALNGTLPGFQGAAPPRDYAHAS
jgi:putative flavoprotein involved in K+ transport